MPLFTPLAERMRPRTLDEYAGQSHLLADGKPLRRAIEEEHLHSMLFWGPPGTGKTTLARLIANYWGADFITLSAVLAGVKDIRAAVEAAEKNREQFGKTTVLFVDEVHRFNKAQQDAFLPYVESGVLIFVGATTENPSFELNNALLSRVRTYVLRSLTADDIKVILQQALQDEEKGLGERKLELTHAALDQLVAVADGDARRALNWLEIASDLAEETAERRFKITDAIVREVASEAPHRFDKGGDVFYEQISALHKSVRGSDPDAALYWMCRMLDGGCDPLYIARRLVRIASEDIGNADPRALQLALNAWDTYERLGSPEGELTLGQAVIYLACAKSGSLDVPMHLRNAPTTFMKKLDYGKNYRYAHNEEDAYAAGENYFPDSLKGKVYYEPVERGLEIKIAAKMRHLRGRGQSTKE